MDERRHLLEDITKKFSQKILAQEKQKQKLSMLILLEIFF